MIDGWVMYFARRSHYYRFVGTSRTVFNMQFKTAIISVCLAAASTHAFTPSLHKPSPALTTQLFSSLAVSAEDINAKLAIQMKKLREKDSTSASMTKDVS
jgi:hypothetical protein